MESLEEPLRDRRVEESVGQKLLQRLGRALPVGIVVEHRPSGADDPKVGRQQAVVAQAVERRKQHAPG